MQDLHTYTPIIQDLHAYTPSLGKWKRCTKCRCRIWNFEQRFAFGACFFYVLVWLFIWISFFSVWYLGSHFSFPKQIFKTSISIRSLVNVNFNCGDTACSSACIGFRTIRKRKRWKVLQGWLALLILSTTIIRGAPGVARLKNPGPLAVLDRIYHCLTVLKKMLLGTEKYFAK